MTGLYASRVIVLTLAPLPRTISAHQHTDVTIACVSRLRGIDGSRKREEHIVQSRLAAMHIYSIDPRAVERGRAVSPTQESSAESRISIEIVCLGRDSLRSHQGIRGKHFGTVPDCLERSIYLR